MSCQRIPRLKYKRRTTSFKLPVFLLDRLRKERNQTEVVETAVMQHLGMEYPENDENK